MKNNKIHLSSAINLLNALRLIDDLITRNSLSQSNWGKELYITENHLVENATHLA